MSMLHLHLLSILRNQSRGHLSFCFPYYDYAMSPLFILLLGILIILITEQCWNIDFIKAIIIIIIIYLFLLYLLISNLDYYLYLVLVSGVVDVAGDDLHSPSMTLPLPLLPTLLPPYPPGPRASEEGVAGVGVLDRRDHWWEVGDVVPLLL